MPGGTPMISSVLSYYRTRLAALGRTEWEDPNFETLPQNKLSKAFHLEFQDTSDAGVHNDNQHISVPTVIRIPFAPTRKPTELIDTAIAFADTVIADFLNPRNRLTQSNGLKTVFLNTMGIDPLAQTNDNGVIIRLEMAALVVIDTR